AVDLEAVMVLAAGRHARRLDRADGAVLEAGERERGVVHGDLSLLVRPVRERALVDEPVEQPADLPDLADQEAGEVDRMGGKVAERAGAGGFTAQPPDQRELRVDDPVLEVGAAEVADLAEPAI